MKKILIVLLLFGITIFYDVDNEIGWVWVNASVENGTILAYPKTNQVLWYSSSRLVYQQTWDEFLKESGGGILKSLKNSGIIIHRKNLKEGPKIIY
jgi:hypothetical protein